MKHLPTIFFSALLVCIMPLVSCNKNNDSQTTTKTKCVSCANGGACIHDTCSCPVGYEGTFCETLSRTKFLGNWTVFEKGSTSNAAQYEVSITTSANLSQITIINFNNFFISPIVADVHGDTIVIQNQQHNGKVTFGHGYIYTNATFGQFGALSLSYEVIDTATLRVDDYGVYSSDLSDPSSWNK